MILVADDELNNRIIIGKLLNQIGFDVEFAENGNQVIDLVKAKNYQLIILDINMPEKNGFECAQYIKNLPIPINRTPIIALTAGIDFEQSEPKIKQLFSHFFEKPLNFDHFKTVVKDLCVSENIKVKNQIPKSQIIVANKPNNNPQKVELDLSYLQNFSFGDTQFVKEMLESIKTDLPIYLQEISNAVNQQNFIAVKAIAHKFNSPLSWIGLKNHHFINYFENEDLTQISLIDLQEKLLSFSNFIESVVTKLTNQKF